MDYGTHADCDIRVESRAVSARHCKLTERGESFLLEDLQSTNGTFIAGEKITGPQLVRRGDPVTLGRNTPLPWPRAHSSITIGRHVDNDVVIPLDAVSGEHARLEREGDRIFLVDLGSTNGTAINDPLNKIRRAVLRATDAVFLGTHRVPAADLIAALPLVPTEATVFEGRSEPALASAPTASHSAATATVQSSPAPSAHAPSAWLWGAALSVLCAAAILTTARSCGQHTTTVVDADMPSKSSDSDIESVPNASPPQPKIPDRRPPADVKHAPEEATVHRADDAVMTLGLRTDRQLALTNVTAWAFQGNAVICPTSTLKQLDGYRSGREHQDESIVVCTPQENVAILGHKAVNSDKDLFSVARLEVPHTTVCELAASNSVCLPGQKLAMLSAHSQNHDPTTLVRKLTHLTVDRVDRGGDGQPTFYKCRYDQAVEEPLGSPVFDASGKVIGCAAFLAPQAHEIHVVPLARLAPLFETQP